MNLTAQNFSKILDKLPFLVSVLSKINDARIRYGLFAGSHVSILTSNRVPSDIDFLVSDKNLLKLKSLFPFAKTKDCGDGVTLFIGRNDEIEFAAYQDVYIDDSHYTFRLTELCWKNTSLLKGSNFKVRLCNAVDTILLKAMLQRGKEKGKHDLEDIEALVKNCKIDKKYLRQRLIEVNQDERLLKVLRKYELVKRD